MILSDRDITDLCTTPLTAPLIEPFSLGVSGGGVISYGLTTAGYDLRLAEDVLRFVNSSGHAVDPKKFGNIEYRDAILEKAGVYSGEGGQFVLIPPNSYILGRSYEYIRVPRKLKGRCVGKSTYARSGILINTTPLEPGWEGYLTIEIGNITPCFSRVYVMEGIAQLEFEELKRVPETDYAQKGGKYQAQTGVTPSRVL